MYINILRFEHVAIIDPNSGEIDNDGTFKKGVCVFSIKFEDVQCSVYVAIHRHG